MEIGDHARQLTVHLFGIRGQLVPGPKSGFHMAHFDLLKERRVAGQESRQRIAVHQHDVRLRFAQYRLQPLKHADRNLVQRLPIFHHVQIVIRLDLEHFQYLVEHLAMLSRHADDRFDPVRVLLQFENQRSHLDRFRAHAEDRHDLDLIHSLSSHLSVGIRKPRERGRGCLRYNSFIIISSLNKALF